MDQWCVSFSRRLQPPIAEQIVSQLGLPFEILSTPPGAALRHTIEAVFDAQQVQR